MISSNEDSKLYSILQGKDITEFPTITILRLNEILD
jgi:hypothetical protein